MSERQRVGCTISDFTRVEERIQHLQLLLPCLAKGSQFNVKRPSAAILVNDVPNLIRDRSGFNEEVIRPLRVTFPRPLQVNHGVDDEIGDVHALWA